MPLHTHTCADLSPLLSGILVQRWVGAAEACTVLDTLVRELGMDLLKPLPCTDATAPGTPAELALLGSPPVLKHMVERMGLSVNACLGAAMEGGTLLHRLIRAVVVFPESSAALLESLHVLLDAGADPDRRDQGDMNVVDCAMMLLSNPNVNSPQYQRTMRAASRVLLARMAPSSFYAGLDEAELAKVGDGW